MNINQTTEKILKNWPIKIICLIIAIFLYLFHQSSLIEKRTFVIPLSVIEDGAVMHVGDVQKNISVVVRASKDDMLNIRYTDIGASVSLNSIMENGIYDLPVKISFSDKMLEFDTLEIRIKPEKVKVTAEKKMSRYVPVEASIVGNVSAGYDISTVECNPSFVQVFGPESIVNNLECIYTEKVNVSNAQNNFTTEAVYQNYNRLIKLLDTDPCKVTVSLERQKMEKEFTGIKISPLNLDDGLELQKDFPELKILVSGFVNILDKYSLPKNAVQVDLRDITEAGTYEMPVRINLPSNISVVSKSLDKVTVVVEKKIDIEQEQSDNELDDSEGKLPKEEQENIEA